MSEWIKSHVDLADHPKTYALTSTFDGRVPAVIGTLHLLWWFAMRYAWRDGDLTRYGPVVIAKACHWDKDPNILITALQEAGFLDGLKVHDWRDFAGRLVRDRIRYHKANGIRTQRGRNTDVIRPRNVAKSRVEESRVDKNTPLPPKGAFEIIWGKYPRKEGRKEAERHFKASVKTDKDWLDIQNALDNFIRKHRRLGTEERFIPHGSTWFNNWRDDVQYEIPRLTAPAPAIPPRPPDPPMTEAESKAGAEFFGKIKKTLTVKSIT